MRSFLLLIGLVLLKLTLVAQPVITSFTPTSGPIGTVVTITGANFNNTAVNNIVFFGAVRAVVSAASASSLTVTVPVGTTYDPITVTAGNLTAYSNNPFLVTFPGAGPVFTSASFDPPVTFGVGNYPYGIANIDLDIDGKPDLVTTNYEGYSISLLRNLSTVNNVSYQTHTNLPTGMFSIGVANGDLDGDGKADIAAVNWAANTVSIFRNTSVAGSISFAPKIEFSPGVGPQAVAIADIDGDGRPDMVIGNVNSHDISVFRNTGSPGLISFAAPAVYPVGYNATSVVIRDLDGDGKPDIAGTATGSHLMVLFRNTSTVGNISFDPRIDMLSTGLPSWITAGDLDGDGKTDLVVSNYNAAAISFYRNLSTPGTIIFGGAVYLSAGPFPNHVTTGDLDGDGKPEIVLGGNDGFPAPVSVFKNTSTVGNIGFATKVDYPVVGGAYDVKVGDVDGDGRPDIVTSAYGYTQVSVLRNSGCISANINTQPVNAAVCVGANASFSITSNNTTGYQWQENSGSGWNNLSDNAVYSGTHTSTLNITGATLAMNLNQYRCIVNNTCGNLNSNQVSLFVSAYLTPAVTITTASTVVCAASSVTFTAYPINGGAFPNYQWKKNGINVGTSNANYSTNTLVNGDIITCQIISGMLCLTVNTAMSNSIVMSVNPTQASAVSIVASANNICAGIPVIFTASPINGGASPFYQWTKNGINIGTNSSVYTDNTLTNNDIIKCSMTSSVTCVSPASAVSNQVVMNIMPLVTPLITISASANNICPGTTVLFTSSISNGGPLPTYQWKKNGIPVGTNNSSYSDNIITAGDIISCDLTSNANCLTTSSVSSNSIIMFMAPIVPVNLGPDKAICSGDNLIISAQPGYASYLWQDSSTNSSYTASAAGNYRVTATDICGVVSTDYIQIKMNLKPAGFLPADSTVCTNQSLLIVPSGNYVSYLWNTNSVTPTLNINTPGLYWLQVTDNNLCKGRDSILILPKHCLTGLFVANAFTPNGDTKNDLLKPALFGIVKQYQFKVYNRYGVIIFETKELSKGWDGTFKGKAQNSGAYIWRCTFQIDNQLVTTENGSVLLIR